tara:strand:+ start:1281 stop:1856 length:576 start_codon:yes stop_codon:yes gene_type:complete
MKKQLRLAATILAIIIVFCVMVFFSESLASNETVIHLTDKLGYLGVTIVAIIAGLNTVIPLPAATFTPIFQSAGLALPFIIFFLALGTLIADSIGFLLGHVSKDLVETKYPKLFSFITNIQENHHRLILPVVTGYAAFVPFPNEVLLIPLALAGIKFRYLLLPLIVGNIIHQAVLIFGIDGLRQLLSQITL